MATQIFGRDHVIPRRSASEKTKEVEIDPRGGAMRGLFFALLFNVLVVLAGVVLWQFWKLLR